jgi:hypothetical protein
MDGSDVGFLVDFPAIGLLIFLFRRSVVRMIGGGGHFMCMGPHHHDSEEITRLRRELEELREQVKKQAAAP